MGVLVDPFFEELVAGTPQSLKVKVEGLPDMGSVFPVEYTCDGRDTPPRVTVTGYPGSARSIALVMYDPDAPIGTFIHWLAYNPSCEGEECVFPGPGVVEGRNDFGRIGYGGPCPPRGHGAHRYYFLALALGEAPKLGKGYKLRDLARAVRGKILGWGYWMGRYSRG